MHDISGGRSELSNTAVFYNSAYQYTVSNKHFRNICTELSYILGIGHVHVILDTSGIVVKCNKSFDSSRDNQNPVLTNI